MAKSIAAKAMSDGLRNIKMGYFAQTMHDETSSKNMASVPPDTVSIRIMKYLSRKAYDTI